MDPTDLLLLASRRSYQGDQFIGKARIVPCRHDDVMRCTSLGAEGGDGRAVESRLGSRRWGPRPAADHKRERVSTGREGVMRYLWKKVAAKAKPQDRPCIHASNKDRKSAQSVGNGKARPLVLILR